MLIRNWFAFLILGIFLSACSKESTLHVIQAPRGEISQNQLVLDSPHSTITKFSHHMNKASYVHQSFQQAWDQSNFSYNPPNALLIVEDKQPIIVELTLVSWHPNQAVFEIHLLAGTSQDTPEDEFPLDIAKEYFPQYFKSPITIIFNQ